MPFTKGADFAPHNMTNGGAPPPYVASDNGNFSPFGGFACFDGLVGTSGYFIGTSMPSMVLLDIGAGNAKKLFSFALHMNTVPEPARAPKDYKIQGSNDNLAFTDLGSTTGQTGWASGETRETNCTVVGTAWRWFRIVITANNGDPSYSDISEAYLYEALGSAGSQTGGAFGPSGGGQKAFPVAQ